MDDLTSLSTDDLFREMARAYNRQGYLVDNGGGSDQTWDAERRCDVVNAEIERRGLSAAYWAWEDEGIVYRRFGREHDKPCKRPEVITCKRYECQRANECQAQFATEAKG